MNEFQKVVKCQNLLVCCTPDLSQAIVGREIEGLRIREEGHGILRVEEF